MPAIVPLGRRAFLQGSSLLLAPLLCDRTVLGRPHQAASEGGAESLRIGLVTDLHYADKPPAGSRYYRESLDKLAEAAAAYREVKPHFVVELGDLIDAADSVAVETEYLKRINKELASICDQRHYVLGNHCVATLRKEEFLQVVERPQAFYSFDEQGMHFVVLDACFRSDGEPYGRNNFKWTDANIPAEELDWLAEDLRATERPTLVFAHQRLDVHDNHGVRNAAAVRKVLEGAGQVQAVFQGHSHQNDYRNIAGIHYCTMVAMVEGSGPEQNGYSWMEIAGSGAIEVHGFRKQKPYQWVPAPS
ncbi:metallophosphoesterase family protein [Aureliella helgolandensis]|uniref:Calcineurin-like phosphoesterase superfamily domain protein n=1 Tax=Aureliella helgolandensis TaxID=2527968 RepID=A0A518G234_9BACT|nr:metallophosphoesterase [Aureliella helgolandensis]QDV22609.1 Calcineurin-like phosphoesterase superfamily domain protein [Aureliella helgolandensis]